MSEENKYNYMIVRTVITRISGEKASKLRNK